MPLNIQRTPGVRFKPGERVQVRKNRAGEWGAYAQCEQEAAAEDGGAVQTGQDQQAAMGALQEGETPQEAQEVERMKDDGCPHE